jgi:hypothetical protein
MGRRTRTSIAFSCLTPLRVFLRPPTLADRDDYQGIRLDPHCLGIAYELAWDPEC